MMYYKISIYFHINRRPKIIAYKLKHLRTTSVSQTQHRKAQTSQNFLSHTLLKCEGQHPGSSSLLESSETFQSVGKESTFSTFIFIKVR